MIFLYIAGISGAQEVNQNLFSSLKSIYYNGNLNQGKSTDDTGGSQFMEIKEMLEQNPEAIYNPPQDYDQLFAIQDTFYRLDSIIYFNYPSENDSVFYTKEISQYLPNGRYKGIIKYIYDDVHDSWMNLQKSIYYFDTADVSYIVINSDWDMTIQDWRHINRKDYELDEFGKTILIIDYNWNKTIKDWRPIKRVDYEFNEFGAIILSHNQNWDTLNNVWITDYKVFRDFDDNKNIIRDGVIYWSKEEGIWIFGSKYEFEFNDKKQKISESRFHYDPLYPKWIGDLRTVMEYDGELMISKTFYNWEEWGGTWLQYQKQEYQYDDQYHQTAIITSAYDDYFQEWYYLTKQESVYTVSGIIILSGQYDWSGDSWILKKQDTTIIITSEEKELIFMLSRNDELALWDSVKRTENYFDEGTEKFTSIVFEYNENGWLPVNKTITRSDDNGISYSEKYKWDNFLQQFTGTNFFELLYNNNGDVSRYTSFKWSEERNEWIGNFKDVITYYDFGYRSSLSHFIWDTINADWKTDYKYFRYYSTIIFTDDQQVEFPHSDIIIYPNPAGDYLNISLNRELQGNYPYYIYSISGKLISTGTITAPSAVMNVTELQNGFYILKVGYQPGFTSKILIRK